MKREKIAEGAYFTRVSDPRFKFNRIMFGFFTPLCDEEKAARHALIPRLLYRSNADYPVSKDFNNYLASLYNAKNDFEVASLGDTQFLGVSMNFMDDGYALHGEEITKAAARELFNCVFNPSVTNEKFGESQVELCKREQIEAIEAEINEKRLYASNQARRIICEGEPAAVNPLGTAEKTRALAPETLYKSYKDLLSSAVIEIICVGRNDFSGALSAARESFPSLKLKRENIVQCESAYSPLKAVIRTETEKLPALNQSKMVLGFKTDDVNHSALSIMNGLYGGTLSSKLFLNVREKLSLCYYCWARFNREKGIMSVNCGVERDNIEKAKAEILAQLELVKKGDFTEDELNHALLFEQNNIKTVNDSLSSLTWWYLTRIYTREIKSPEEFLKNYDGITREDIIKAADSMKLDTFYVLTADENSENNEERKA